MPPSSALPVCPWILPQGHSSACVPEGICFLLPLESLNIYARHFGFPAFWIFFLFSHLDGARGLLPWLLDLFLTSVACPFFGSNDSLSWTSPASLWFKQPQWFDPGPLPLHSALWVATLLAFGPREFKKLLHFQVTCLLSTSVRQSLLSMSYLLI